MEQEAFVTGYCRQIDRSRMVCAVLEDNRLTECDCCYGSCIYEPECQVAAQLRQLPLLIGSILLYAGGAALTFRASARAYEKVDL